MPASAHALHGLLPVIQTPFLADGSIDHQTLAREVEWAFDQGADGVTTGMVSEVLRLATDERFALAKTICSVANGRTTVLSCGAESTFVAVRNAVEAQACGATALMAIPPLHTPLDDDALFNYFRAILDATQIPLVVQDASGYVGHPLPPDLLVRLVDAFGPRVSAKPEAQPIGPNLSALRDATGGRIAIFEGTGGIALIDSFRRGIAGTMPAVDLCWAIRRLWDALRAGDEELSYRIGGPLASMISLQTSLDSFVVIEKYLLVKQGVFPDDRTRGPVSFRLDPETIAEVDRLYDRLCEVVRAAPAGAVATPRAGTGDIAREVARAVPAPAETI